ncbi:hypothetical protein [Pseudomonas trivialis]|uniref:Uncharacterized protein n=1 Tax=Pseudomonas trivialis TaxID=200450 RepID=A0A0R2ZJM0_9PSED|nr:hypothetical protein [Pseudomonas trivialis]KRP58628.1 hypothetical protein TU79_19265 [Pseudomonas trivialis]SDS75252.1 hypothetical protein SAMN04490205_3520 [Pseudomonas trivialis]
MRVFAWLFSSTPDYRDFALLDNHGVCIAFKRCTAQPANGDWVAVNEINLSWLGRPLPGRARTV